MRRGESVCFGTGLRKTGVQDEIVGPIVTMVMEEHTHNTLTDNAALRLAPDLWPTLLTIYDQHYLSMATLLIYGQYYLPMANTTYLWPTLLRPTLLRLAPDLWPTLLKSQHCSC